MDRLDESMFDDADAGTGPVDPDVLDRIAQQLKNEYGDNEHIDRGVRVFFRNIFRHFAAADSNKRNDRYVIHMTTRRSSSRLPQLFTHRWGGSDRKLVGRLPGSPFQV